MLYTAVTTPRLEPSERAWFLDALEPPPWWKFGRSPIDDAIKETGLDVVGFETKSPEYSEALMAVDPREINEQLAVWPRCVAPGSSWRKHSGPPGTSGGSPGRIGSSTSSWGRSRQQRGCYGSRLTAPEPAPTATKPGMPVTCHPVPALRDGPIKRQPRSYWATPGGRQWTPSRAAPSVPRNAEQATPNPDKDQVVTVRPATVGDEAALAELNAVVQRMHHEAAPEWFKLPEIAPIAGYFREALRSDALRTLSRKPTVRCAATRFPCFSSGPRPPDLRWPCRRARPDQRRPRRIEAGAWGESSSTG